MKRICLMLLVLAALCVIACPVYAEEQPEATSEPVLSEDIVDAYDQYGAQLPDALDSVQDQYDGVVDPGVLGFVGAAFSWMPADLLFVLLLMIALAIVVGIIRFLMK